MFEGICSVIYECLQGSKNTLKTRRRAGRRIRQNLELQVVGVRTSSHLCIAAQLPLSNPYFNPFLAGGGPKNPKNPKKGKEQGPGSETDFMTVLLDPKNRGSVLALFTSLAIGGVLLLGGESNQREVTWQEFRAKYLDEGKVERIEVVNKTTAKVFVTPESTNSCVLAS